ncbi:hypothetical protein EFP18_14095 [Burkholderia glumae]|nr:hypothetical protein NCPPB3923_12915 [Burkholderia glumae]PNL02109.1 hypothetical protein CEQ24_024635 [Burkholderia glumae]RQZ74044.1 hypothetical protein DF052_10925 [Burkholderia glumae]UVS85135.1 hypothetical protein EFP18_14095 [Burkholderia glumae]UVS89738.1 hypothetical protein EFP17_07975 [Burkholderia glumae]
MPPHGLPVPDRGGARLVSAGPHVVLGQAAGAWRQAARRGCRQARGRLAVVSRRCISAALFPIDGEVRR